MGLSSVHLELRHSPVAYRYQRKVHTLWISKTSNDAWPPGAQTHRRRFSPAGTDEESWLGNVFLFRADEGIPTNKAGEPLLPYAQFYLPALPFNSPALKGVRVLTLFVSNPFPEHFEPMGITG